MKMEKAECSETSAYKNQMPGNYPEESIQHSEQGESLEFDSHSVMDCKDLYSELTALKSKTPKRVESVISK